MKKPKNTDAEIQVPEGPLFPRPLLAIPWPCHFLPSTMTAAFNHMLPTHKPYPYELQNSKSPYRPNTGLGWLRKCKIRPSFVLPERTHCQSKIEDWKRAPHGKPKNR